MLLGDGGATSGIIQNGKLAEWYMAQWNQIAEKQRPRTYVFAVGDDANIPLLKMLARASGTLEHVRSTEPIDFKLNAFLAKIGRDPLEKLQFTVSPTAGLVYPLDENVYPGIRRAWVGTYGTAGRTTFTVRGVREGAPFEARADREPAGAKRRASRPAAHVGQGPRRCAARKNRARRARARR